MSQIKIKIEPHFAGDYELKYDGKYLTLFGKDKTYPIWPMGKGNTYFSSGYEVMVLIPVVIEQRGIAPEIIEVTDEFITIELNEIENEEKRT